MISTKNIVFFNFIKDGVNNFWNQTWLNIVIKVEKLSFRIKVSRNYDFIRKNAFQFQFLNFSIVKL